MWIWELLIADDVIEAVICLPQGLFYGTGIPARRKLEKDPSPHTETCREDRVEYQQARIVDTRYRLDSCTPKNNLSFNWHLIKAPIFVIDLVLVHELAHLREGNHTPKFWNIVRAQHPLMEKAKAWLSQHGQLLEDEL